MESIFELLAKGGIVMIPLGICSVVALAIILERMWALRRGQVIPGGAMGQLETWLIHHDRPQMETFCSESSSSLARLLRATLDNSSFSLQFIKQAVEGAGKQEAINLERYLSLLETIAAISPLLGLLGTVSGMIKVFSIVAVVGIGNAGYLASGISEALLTTAAGLVVAIPALIMHRYFISKIDQYVVELELCAVFIVERLVPVAQDDGAAE